MNIQQFINSKINVVLPMLNVPNLQLAEQVVKEVIKYNKGAINDNSIFVECASLVISEMELMPIEQILRHLHSDKTSYCETLEAIRENKDYFTHNNNYEQKYWSDWFNGSDMAQY